MYFHSQSAFGPFELSNSKQKQFDLDLHCVPFKFVQLPEKKIFICNQGNIMFDFFF